MSPPSTAFGQPKPKNIQCKSCLKHVLCDSPPPVCGPKPWNDIWVCRWCNYTICQDCYWKHSISKHPEHYVVPDELTIQVG